MRRIKIVNLDSHSEFDANTEKNSNTLGIHKATRAIGRQITEAKKVQGEWYPLLSSIVIQCQNM